MLDVRSKLFSLNILITFWKPVLESKHHANRIFDEVPTFAR